MILSKRERRFTDNMTTVNHADALFGYTKRSKNPNERGAL